MPARSSRCNLVSANVFPSWLPRRRWNPISARLSCSRRVALSCPSQWAVMASTNDDYCWTKHQRWSWFDPQLPENWVSCMILLKDVVVHTASSCFRPINHNCHALIMASWTFMRWGMSFSCKSSRSKRRRSQNSRHSMTLIDCNMND